MARQIEAYKLRTELAVDSSKGSAAIKSFQKDVDNAGTSVKKLGKNVDEAGKEAGTTFGKKFSATATSVITGSFDSLGQTLGSIIGTAMMPGIGTAVGSTIGSMVDKLGGTITPMIKDGIELNKVLEQTTVEFTTFAGSAEEAKKYLADIKKMAVETGNDPKFLIETSERLFDLTDSLKLSTTLLKAATDQAADFGGSAEVITKVADALGLVAEKGELASRDLKTLFKVGIDAKKYLAEATGLSEKQIAKFIAEGRIRGDVASRLIAEGIERKKGGFAAQVAATTLGGAQARFGARIALTEAEGTEKLASGLKDMYNTADKVLASDTAQKLVHFLDSTAGTMIDFAEKGIMGGINLAQGVADGITGADAFKAVGSSIKTFGNFIESEFKDIFDIRSPSHVMEREVGIPLGQGIADGLLIGFQDRLTDGNLGAGVEKQISEFFEKHAAEAIAVMQQTGIPASVILGMGALESRFGKSGLAQQAQNYFSIKGRGPAGSVTMRTREETRSGASYYVNAPFRAYASAQQSFSDFGQFLLGKRYRGALAYANDPAQYVEAIRRAGYATDTKYTSKVTGVIGRYNLQRFDAGGGAGVQPVAVVQWGSQDITGAASSIFGAGAGGPQDIQGGAKAIFGAVPKATEQVQTFVEMINDTIPVIVDVNAAQDELIKTDVKRQNALARMSEVTLKSLSPLEAQTLAENERTKNAIAITKESQKANREQLIRAQDTLALLGGAVGQIAGMMPTQQVGKKRGLFSKILGLAAPFLNFIPGVGPILSTIAGAASAGIGGNFGGMVSSIAGGLASGGVFNPLRDDKHVDSGLISTTNATANMATTIDLKKLLPPRAGGGPVYRGERYVVGERGTEIYTPAADGYITPHGAGAAGTGAGGSASAMLEAAAQLREAVTHLTSMPASHVVMRGARGLVRAMDNDAGLIRLVSQRQRLA